MSHLSPPQNDGQQSDENADQAGKAGNNCGDP
jgi:hypothetical protein